MNVRTRCRVVLSLLLTAIVLSSGQALAAAPAAASGFGTGTVVLLVLGLAAVGLTLLLNPFGGVGLVGFLLVGLANLAFLVRSSLADSTERIAGSIVAFVVLIVIASHRSQERIAQIKAAEAAAFRERQEDGE